MLILTRKLGERIVVQVGNEKVTIAILKVGATRVQVGVDAPPHVAVRRQELLPRDRAAVA